MENLILDTSGGEKFVCPFPECQREFQKRWSLTRHMRKHTGEKPFRCGICNKEFVEKCGLVRHEQTHAQERHWECDVPGCKKKFKLKEYLDIHKKTWHARNDLSNSNEFTLRTTEPSGTNDTTEQLRQRLVRMSIRHREMIFSQQQREAELLLKLRNCSNFLQNSLNHIQFDSQEKKDFKSRAVQFLNESIALGSEDTESSSDGQSHDGVLPPSDEFLSAAPENLMTSSFLNQADHSISEYLSRQIDSYAEENSTNLLAMPHLQNPTGFSVDPASAPLTAHAATPLLLHRKRPQADTSSEPPSKFPHIFPDEQSSLATDPSPGPRFTSSHATAFNPHSPSTAPLYLQPSSLPPTPTSISSSTMSSSYSAPLYSQLSSGIPPSMTISQSCTTGQTPCSPIDGNVFELMFSLSSEVNPSSSENLFPPPAPPVPSLHSLTGTSSSTLMPSVAATGLLCSQTTLTPTDDQPSTNIADVMAWIKNNPLKTTKRYI